jgi:DNA-binding XRE family transcriptional regulator
MLGATFHAWRTDLKMTQESAGKRFGVSRFTVQKWESDQADIPKHVETLMVWISREIKQQQDDFPVQLAYCDAMPWVEAGKPLAQVILKDFPCNSLMLRGVHELLNSGHELHLASVIEKGRPEMSIWQRDELIEEIRNPKASRIS